MGKKVSKRYHEQVQEIQQLLAGRPYSIGLDLGVGSIGLAVAAYDKQTNAPTDLVFATSRIFSPSAGAADRRQQRGQRNALRHKANRLRYLWKLLASKNLMLPYSKQDVPDPARLRFSEDIIRKDPYELRYTGLTEQLTLPELGYALYHIANHRGASSIRTFLDDEKSSDDKKLEEQERETEKLAKEKGLSTFIEVLVAFNTTEHIGFRNKDSLKDKKIPVPTRDIITREIEVLLTTQKEFYPDVLTSEFCDQIQAAILYENLKIVPEPGNCPYFSDEKKLPRCHFLNEERRLWEAINNARIESPVDVGSFIRRERGPFSMEQRKQLFAVAREGKNITVPLVRSLFSGMEHHTIILQGKDKATQKIDGFRFKELERKPFWSRLTEDQQDDFFFAWTNMPDDEQLASFLSQTVGLQEEEIDDALKTIKLVGDYGPIGKTATKLLMKYIEDGLTFNEAVEEAVQIGELERPVVLSDQANLPYYGKVLTETTQELAGKYWHSAFKERRNSPGFKKPNTASDEERFGRIANPVVHQTLNELRKLLNEVIEVLGTKPVEVVVELGRELKVGAVERERIAKDQSDREKQANQIYDKFCKPNGLGRRYIEHFRLLEDQKFSCPYCLKTINVTDVGSGRVEVDHILPREDTGDNSYANKVVAHRHCNQQKGKRTPYAAFSSLEIWSQIMHYLDDTPPMRLKRRKFEITDDQYKKYLENRGFASRFSTDNSYIAKATLEYLRCLYNAEEQLTAVRSLNGRETSILRKSWNLQGITEEMGRLHFDKKESPNDVTRKNRNDNRHHALDAIVALYCSRSLINDINTKSARGMSAAEIEDTLPLPNHQRFSNLTYDEYREHLRSQIHRFLSLQTFVSLKSDHAVNGPLLKDTIYSILGANPDGNELVFVVKKKVKDINPGNGSFEVVKSAVQGRFTANLPKWYPSSLKKRIAELQEHNEKILERYEEQLLSAAADLEAKNMQLKEAGRRLIDINERTVSKRALEMVGGIYYLISNNSRIKTHVVKEPTDSATGFGFDTGSNLCLDFYHDERGKLQGEIIRNVQAMNKDYKPNYRQQGYSLYVRLYQGDVCELTAANPVEEEGETNAAKVARIRVPNAKSNRTFIVINTFTETISGFQIFYSNLAKSRRDKDASFSLGSMQSLDVRKVQLSPAGFVRFVSPLLKDKEK
jgi:CRISPR-associated endonuclease Csn1